MVIPTRYRVSFLLCAIVGVLTGTEAYYWGQVSGKPFSYLHALTSQAPVWLVWALVAPTVARFGQRIKPEWPAVLKHVVGFVATDVFFAGVSALIHQVITLSASQEPMMTELRNSLVYQLPMAAITYAATVGAAYVAEVGRRARELEQMKTQLALAQLSALRMQLNPHFLFNALHTIAVFVREQDEKQAVELIERLGDVLRHVLRTSNAFEAPLDAEIDFVKKYVEIEQARFGDRLSVSYGLGDDLGGALVPQLIVQPLVENALKHGLAPRAAAGHLEIAAERRGETLELRVADDGVGLGPDWDAAQGLGLANVRDRLQKMYGDAARLALSARPSGGVQAIVTLPFRTAAAHA